jgi:hypothetical protein
MTDATTNRVLTLADQIADSTIFDLALLTDQIGDIADALEQTQAGQPTAGAA